MPRILGDEFDLEKKAWRQRTTKRLLSQTLYPFTTDSFHPSLQSTPKIRLREIQKSRYYGPCQENKVAVLSRGIIAHLRHPTELRRPLRIWALPQIPSRCRMPRTGSRLSFAPTPIPSTFPPTSKKDLAELRAADHRFQKDHHHLPVLLLFL